MSWTATVGEKVRVLIPVHPDTTNPHTPDVRLTAEQALTQACAEHGLAAANPHLLWSGTCGDARGTKHAKAAEELPDYMIAFIYEATAA